MEGFCVYQSQDLADNRAQLRSRRLAVYIPAGLLLILTLVSFFLRWPQAVTMILCVLLCSHIIFCYTMFISPVLAYGQHIDHALNGRVRDAQGAFVQMEDQAVLREGLYFYPMTINVGATLRENGDRLFYYDAHLPLPDWQAGETLTLTSYDNRVTAWARGEQ